MDLHTFRNIIDRIDDNALNAGIDKDVVVELSVPNMIGGTACSKVLRIEEGFDWDSGKVFILSEDLLVKKYKSEV